MNYFIQRNRLNLKRHKMTLLISIPLFTLMMTLIGMIYSGPELVQAVLKVPYLKSLLNNFDVTDANMLVWFLIYANVFIMLFPVVGIFLGVRMLPFNERDGKELIFSTKLPIMKYFIENFLLVMVLIPIISFPVFIIPALYLGFTTDALISMGIATIIPVFFVWTVAMVSVFGASLKSSSRIGYAFGAIFFLTFFVLNLIAQELIGTPLKILNDFNLMYQMNIFGNALNKTWNENYLLACLAIIIVLFVLTLVFLYRTDYIETRSNAIRVNNQQTGSKGSFIAKFSFIRTPVESVLNRVGWKYPPFRDQLQSSAGFFILYIIFTTMMVFVVVLAYPGKEAMTALFTDLGSLISNPMIAGFLFGNKLTIENANFQGFLLFKFLTFHWIYYGPYLFLGTYYVVMRDKNAKYDEITWSLPRTRSSVIFSRTAAMILYFWITMAINWIGLLVGEVILSSYMTVTQPDNVATLLVFVFLGLGYSLFLILFIGFALIVNSRYITITLVGIFAISIFIPVIAYSSNADWIQFFSPFRYFDVIGILINPYKIITSASITILVGGVAVLLFYFLSIKLVTPRKDIS